MGRIRRGTTDIEVNLNNRHLTCIEDDIFQKTLTPNKILRRDTISISIHEVISEDESKILRNRSSRPVVQSSSRPKACNFIKKEILAQVLSCESCEISKNTFWYRTPLMAASGEGNRNMKRNAKKQQGNNFFVKMW